MRPIFTARLAVLLTSVAPLALPVLAIAQTAQPHASPSIDDIVVTARRSEESIQSTPVSVTAFNADMLREANIATTADLMIKTPGVYLSGSGGRENSVFQIRGQSKALSGSNAPAVVSYFADVPAPTFGSGVATYDMASVQVLKGPQGTLFGRNTTGGAVLYYPAAPEYVLGGYVEAGYGRYERKQLEGALSIPIVDNKLAVRVAGRYEKRDGYTKNIGLGGDLDDVNSRAFRVSVLAEPVEGFKNLTIFDWYRNNYTGDAVLLTSLFDNPSLIDLLGLRSAMQEALAAQQARGPRVIDSDVSPAINRTRRWGITNRTDIDLSDSGVSFTNIFGYRKTYVNYNINTDGVPLLITTGNPAAGLPAGLPLTLLNAGAVNNVEQYTNEVQIKGSALDDRVDWLVGGFYLKSQPYGPTGSGNSIAQVVLPPFLPAENYGTFQYNFYTEKSKALFGNVNIKLDEIAQGLRFNAGLRYTWDKEIACTATDNTTQGTVRPNECVSTNPILIGATTNTAKSDAPTWTVGFDWQVTPDLFTYISTRRGYRTGGINTPTFGGRLAPYQSFGPERVTDLELGVRSDWTLGDVRVRLNLSGFVGYYDGVQIALSGLLTQPGCVAGDPVFGEAPFSPDGDCSADNDPQSGTMLANAGKSRVAGLDFDGRILFSDRLTFTFGGNLLDTKTRELTAPAPIAAYLTTQEIPFDLVAKATFTLGAQYRIPLGAMGDLNASADYYHSSKLSFVDTALPAYGLANIRLDWRNVGGRPIDVGVTMTNVFNKTYQAIGAVSGAGLGFNTAIFGPPRQYGLTLRYRLGE